MRLGFWILVLLSPLFLLGVLVILALIVSADRLGERIEAGSREQKEPTVSEPSASLSSQGSLEPVNPTPLAHLVPPSASALQAGEIGGPPSAG
jgi:hypothetical protein